jgi:ubiquinone/menaquinone biosynthesis C-methylase UbiE
MFTEIGILKLIKRKPGRPFDAALAMLGVKGSDRVLFCGADRPDVAGAVGAVTGLNGQTTVVDRKDGAAARIEAGAAKAGALVDFQDAPLTMLPFDSGTWDAAIIVRGLGQLGSDAGAVLSEAVRVIRAGGRIVLMDPVSRPGLFGLWRNPVEPVRPADSVTAALTGAGLRGVRLLAEVDGVRYFEGTKVRS